VNDSVDFDLKGEAAAFIKCVNTLNEAAPFRYRLLRETRLFEIARAGPSASPLNFKVRRSLRPVMSQNANTEYASAVIPQNPIVSSTSCRIIDRKKRRRRRRRRRRRKEEEEEANTCMTYISRKR
jgi:hypothetical protein